MRQRMGEDSQKAPRALHARDGAMQTSPVTARSLTHGTPRLLRIADNLGTMADETSTKTARPTLVVGIATSADGLEAVRHFLSNIPRQSGLAFVLVVQDPLGSIAETLEFETLQVRTITSRITVAPNHLYVTSPDTSLTLREGILYPEPAVTDAALQPTDAFLISLARDAGPRAAAVLFSGTRADGVMGMKEIHEAVGLCIVQTPGDARSPSTPQQAIDAGVADRVARARDMAKILVDHARTVTARSERAAPTPSGPDTDDQQPRQRTARLIEHHVLHHYVRPCIVVNRDLEILHFFGQIGDSLAPPKGAAQLTLRAWARPSLYPRLRAGLLRAAERHEQVVVRRVALDNRDPRRRVTCIIDPLDTLSNDEELFLIAFEETVAGAPPEPVPSEALGPLAGGDEDELASTREALSETVQQLETTREKLDTSRRSVQALQARVEELKRLRDESQSRHHDLLAAKHDLESRTARLQSGHDALEDLLAGADIPIIVLDLDMRVRNFTPAASQVMRLVTADIGRPIGHVKERFVDPDLMGDVEHVIETLAPTEREITTDDARTYIRRILPFWTEQDRITGVCVTFTDITARKRAEEAAYERATALEGQSRRKDEFLATLGHELRNPLGVVANGLGLLESVRNDPDRSQQIRAMMRRQTARIRALLDQLLDVSGVISGKVPMTLEPVDIVETVIGAVETVNPLIESRKQRLETSTPAKGGTFVLGDEVRLSQAIENLLTTAANHSDDEGIIRLTVEPDYDEVRISVRHDGVSIDDAHLEHIFEVFARGDDPLHQSERGLALSLPLARELVARHGGSIHAKRAGDDGGTVFTITLPRLQRPPSPNAEDERPGRHTGQGTSLRILVVDDETDAAASLADVLKLLGHTTRVAHDGPSALGAVKSFDPEIVLLDLGLPGMDGYEVARRLRHEVSRSGTLLVALTGYPKETGRLEGAGFDDHLIKPVDLQKLQRWLRHLFS